MSWLTVVGARGAGAVGATWARVENAACARRLAAAADVLERLIVEAGAVDREQWCIVNWTIAAAEVAVTGGGHQSLEHVIESIDPDVV
ncbi:hypothetical protein [Mycobacterium lehmannii]|uniref:hypothetical protein n=1 Tax=Mycobacterium lehmannii TaxID=2048550 RepID=UPI000B93BDB9|nr:hypothetical protein [Mycobacterium lehmannii]